MDNYAADIIGALDCPRQTTSRLATIEINAFLISHGRIQLSARGAIRCSTERVCISATGSQSAQGWQITSDDNLRYLLLSCEH